MAEEAGFTRPIGTVPSDAELETLIPKWQEDARRDRAFAESKWLIASAVLDGFPKVNVDWRAARVTIDPYNPKNSVRVKIPETLTRYRREKGRLMSVLRPPSTRPRVTGNPDIWRLNRFATGGAAYIYDTTGFPSVFDEFLSHLLVEGTAGLMPYWDENIIREGKQSGDVNFRVIPGWELFPFPVGVTTDEGLEGITWSRVVSGEWIRQNIPEAETEKTIQVTTPYHTYRGVSTGNPSIFQGHEVRYTFFKASRRFPKGEQIVMVGEKIYRRLGQLNWRVGDRRVLPITVGRFTKKNTSWWGESFAYPVAQLNQETNRIMSLMVRRAILKAHPGWLMVPMGSVTLDDFKTQVGGVIQYRNSIVPGVKSQPQWLNYPPGPADSDVMVNRLDQYIEDTSSQHGPTSGTSTGRVDSNAAISNLIRQDMIPLESTNRSIDQVLQRSFSIALEIGRARWQETKSAMISGPTGGPKQSIQVTPQDIPSMEEVQVVTGLDMPMDRPTLVQFLTNLSVPASQSAEPLISPEEFRRGLVALGVNLPGVDLISPDEETAWMENVTIYGDGVKPGQIDEPDATLEDLTIHLRVHKRFTASLQVRFASSPAVKAAFSEHIRRTAMLIQGSPVPPQFDSEFIRSDADELAERIEADQGGASPTGIQRDLETSLV